MSTAQKEANPSETSKTSNYLKAHTQEQNMKEKASQLSKDKQAAAAEADVASSDVVKKPGVPSKFVPKRSDSFNSKSQDYVSENKKQIVEGKVPPKKKKEEPKREEIPQKKLGSIPS